MSFLPELIMQGLFESRQTGHLRKVLITPGFRLPETIRSINRQVERYIMLHADQLGSTLSDKALAGHFVHAGFYLAEEAQMLGETAYSLVSKGKQLTNKNLIAGLIKALGNTDDIIQADIIRKTLEIVVAHTSDDLSFYDSE